MRIRHPLLFAATLLIFSPAVLAKNEFKAQIIDTKLFNQAGNSIHTIDFSETSLEEFIQNKNESAVTTCFEQLVKDNEDDLKPLLALKGGPIFLNAKPKDTYSADCGGFTLILKFNYIVLSSTAEKSTTHKNSTWQHELVGFFRISKANAGDDKNFPGISSGGPPKSSGVTVVISTATIGTVISVFSGAGGSECSFCTSDPFGGTNPGSGGAGTGTSSGGGSETGSGNE